MPANWTSSGGGSRRPGSGSRPSKRSGTGPGQQVDEPEAAALVRLLTWTADAIRTTIESLSDRRPVPLTPTRLQRLLRL